MRFDGLTDDAILHVAHLLHDQPLLGIPAVRALRQCQRRLRSLLRLLFEDQPALCERARTVSFAWSVPRFSKLRSEMPVNATLRSPEFSTAFGHAFRFLLFPNGNKTKSKHLSVYIEVPDVHFPGWERSATFSMRVLHSHDALQDVVHEDVPVVFTESNRDWGFQKLVHPEDVDEFLRAEETLRVQVSVTVKPPKVDDLVAVCKLWAFGAASVRALHLLQPSMISDLEHAFASTDVNEEWSLCPSCGARLLAPPAVSAREDAPMLCATKGCKSCAVATSHARLRKFVALEHFKQDCEWRKWTWPKAKRDFKPEDLLNGSIQIQEACMPALCSDDLRNKAVEQFTEDLKAVFF